MIIRVDFESDIPIYVQLKNQIIEGIALRQINAGESLPSVRQLAEDIGVNMHTVNKAYNLLKNDGFVKIDRRKGAVVSLDQDNVNDAYRECLREDLTPLIAAAYCKGMDEVEFKEICSEIFRSYKEVDK